MISVSLAQAAELFWMLLVLCLVLSTLGWSMLNLSRKCSKRSARARFMLRLISLSALVITFVGAHAASVYPGPGHRYADWSLANALRNSVIPVSAFSAFFMPVWFTLAISTTGSEDFRLHRALPWVLGFLAAIISLASSYLAVFIGCNHAGACF